LIPSLRIVSFREGMIDATLWAMLNQKNPKQAQALMDKLIFPSISQGHNNKWSDYLKRAESIPRGYAITPAEYHDVRTQMLNILDTGSAGSN